MTDPAVLLALDKAVRDAGLPLNGVREDGDSFSIDWMTEATTEQRAEGDAILANTLGSRPLAEAKASRIRDLDAWFLAAGKAGVEVQGNKFDASVQGRTDMGASGTAVSLALMAGATTAPVTVYALDETGKPRIAVTLPALQMASLLLEYAPKVAELSELYNYTETAIAAATTPEEALAVPMPS